MSLDTGPQPELTPTQNPDVLPVMRTLARIAEKYGLDDADAVPVEPRPDEARDERRADHGQETGAEQTGLRRDRPHSPMLLRGESQAVNDEWFQRNRIASTSSLRPTSDEQNTAARRVVARHRKVVPKTRTGRA